MQLESRTVEQHKRKFAELLNDDEGKYSTQLRQNITDENYRFILNINEVRAQESEWASKIVARPREYLIGLQEAVQEAAKQVDPSFEKILKTTDIQVGFDGSLGRNSVSPRELNSTLLNNLVQVEGIVTKCSNVRPKLVRAVHYCPDTKQYSSREYRDATSIDIGVEGTDRAIRLPTSSTFATEDAEGHKLEIEHGLCKYKSYQTLVLQEMPEKAKVGQLPRSIEAILEHDLVDRVKPGDRIICMGMYRSLPNMQNGVTKGVFRTVLICNNVQILGKEVGAVRLTATDIKNIREVSERPDVLETMSRSLCPSIFGHEFIKKALILQLLGGSEKNLENGTHLRGDINLMMVGDPSTAKSQLLRAVLDIAPLAISTTGRGSSGVGLTAAVTTDPDTGDRRLEAGAMVLADRGVVCIDEFDKMGENDRVAIHEVMEQQTVTIAKAGIHASLNARCSVVAAANPVYGQYDKTRRPQENIGLPDSLLSRFDLLFIVLDQLDPTVDRTLSEHVLRSHQYRRPGTLMEPEPLNQASVLDLDITTADAAVDTVVWQRSGRQFNGDISSGEGRAGDLLTKDFLRKYIHYAKSRMNPELTDEASMAISAAYGAMRSHQSIKNLPITARTLETIIRLSTASAKARLSQRITSLDVDAAMELLNFVLFHEVGGGGRTPSLPGATTGARNLSGGMPALSAQENAAPRRNNGDETTFNPEKKDTFADDADDADDDGEGDDEETAVDRNSSQYLYLQRVIRKYRERTDSVEMSDLLQKLNNTAAPSLAASAPHVSKAMCLKMLRSLERDNKIMLFDDVIQFI